MLLLHFSKAVFGTHVGDFFHKKYKKIYWFIFLWSVPTRHRAECLPFSRIYLVTPPSQGVVMSVWNGSKTAVMFYFSQRTLCHCMVLPPSCLILNAPGVTLLELVSSPMSFCSLHPFSSWTGEVYSVQAPCLCVLSYLSSPRIISGLPTLSSSSVLFIYIRWDYSCPLLHCSSLCYN